MRPLALAAVTFLAMASTARAGDCDACIPATACLRHQKEEAAAMADFKKDKGSKDATKRKAALDKLGRVNNDHMNHRSPDVALAIADMLDDVDQGIRSAALRFLMTNQEARTSREEIGKLLQKMLPKVSKPKPDGKTTASGLAAIEWQNTRDMCESCLDGLAALGGKDVVEHFLKVIESENLTLAASAVGKSAAIHSKKLVQAYLERFAKAQSSKSVESKALLTACAQAFAAQVAFPEILGDDDAGWLKKARSWWREKADTYDPPDPPSDGK